MENTTDYIAIGKLGKTRGTDGEIYVTPMTDFPERFLQMQEIFVDYRGNWQRFRLESARLISGRPVLKFSDIDTPEQAARMTNRFLAVPSDQLVQLPDNTHYIFDLIECDIIDHSTNKRLGTITDVRTYPANDVYVVQTDSGNEILFPVVKQFVRRIDITERKVYVLPGGMFDEPKDLDKCELSDDRSSE